MSTFRLYFQLGIEHILDLQGFDHILFIIALCSLYTLRDWRKVLVLITAFTLGHSFTLALATLGVFKVNSALVEFLIPVTILITAASNIFRRQQGFSSGKIHLNYIFAAAFGLIHGLGFSGYLRSLLGGGRQLVEPLVAFNLGIEIGQILIVGFFLLIAGLLVVVAGINKREWTLGISATIAGMAIMLILQNKIW
ncbi:MAG: HupE/UreJ family protein [Bacteroidetes bacterium]|nr:HupE/UreJ family protein [Bacteroidota bacterium]